MNTSTFLFFAFALLSVFHGYNTHKVKALASQSQINDPAKFQTIANCVNKTLSPDFNLCCTLRVNDTTGLTKQVCVNLRSKNNLEPMATINGYVNGRCKYNSYATVDGFERVWCKGTGNMDKTVMWKLIDFVRVLNPPNSERSLEVCQFGSNFSKCW